MINEIKTIIETAAVVEIEPIVEGEEPTTRPLYPVEYEENRMMNLKADEKTLDSAFAYIEEFVQGSYSKEKYMKQKVTQVQIYFCRFAEMHNSAMDREAIRSQIESEIVFPFMEKYNSSGLFTKVDSFKFFTPLPRFDANEVSIMLQFDCKQNMC